jgi:hypothetical protein
MTRVFRLKCRYVRDIFLLETYYFTSLSEYDTLTMKNILVLSSIFQSREKMYQRIIKQEIYSIDVYEYE